MVRRLFLSFVSLLVPALAVLLMGQGAGASSGCQDLDLNGGQGRADKLLPEKIQEAGLDKFMPKEFQGCNNGKEVWTEFLRGLAKIESDGRSCGKCGDGGKSCGLFQMTGTDKCGGKNSFGGSQAATKDGAKNIECAVYTWKSLLSGSYGVASARSAAAPNGGAQSAGGGIIGNKYWGPCKRNEASCRKVIETVKNQVCNKSGSQPINWNAVNPRGGGGGGGSQTAGGGRGGRG